MWDFVLYRKFKSQVMPNSYAVMNEEEMTYTEGGVKVTLNRKNIAKALCIVGTVFTLVELTN